ncbi:chloramphenicol resistance protein [Companilactobacillus sp. RD055328]|uniref:MFS transporter n=1 Tax=Companilactobacillus sp. RD055328 TaxID=2916634 RepID=UPI001FC889A4|nr:MFS transporter [Companilactobacillus sp. RD055328]GKQ42368.1 chloramphenicol resistance protein [Companilactobacillus sp. RD055328]
MRTYKFQFVVLVLVGFTLGCSEFLISGIISDISRYFDKSISTVGLLVTIFAFVYAVSTPLVTLIVGKYKYFNSFIVMMVLYIIGNLMSATANTYMMLLLSRVVTAAVSGALLSIALTYGNAIAPPKSRAFMLSWIFSGFSIATVAGLPIGTYIAHVANWHYSFWAVIGLAIFTLILGALSLPRDLRAQVGTNSNNQLALMKDPLIIVGILIPIFNAGASNLFNTFLAPLFTDVLKFSATELSILLSIIGLLSIASSQIAGWLANHDGLRKIPYIFVFQFILFMTIYYVFGNSWISLLWILALELTFNMVGSSIQIHFFDVAERSYPQSVVLASSLNPVFFNLGISLGSAGGSMTVSKYGLTSIGFGSAIFVVFGFIILLILNKMIRKSAS